MTCSSPPSRVAGSSSIWSVTILVYPRDNPYSYVEVRGTVTMVEEGGRELIDRLNQEYTGTDRYLGDDGTDNVRVVCRITPDKVVTRLP